jgi:hypothetical protein
MKKLLAAFAVLTFAVVANATDRTGALAIGYQSSLAAGNTDGQWSVKYGLSSNTTLQGVIGFDMAKGPDNEDLTFGARFLYDLVEAENSDFYTGLGVVYHVSPTAGTLGGDDRLNVNVPLGFEFSLANAPAVAFSAEMGLTYSYGMDSENWTLSSNGGGLGGVFTAGAHYYF